MNSEYSAPGLSNHFDTVILVRSAPDGPAARAVLEEVASRRGAAALSVFLHGHGVAWACPDHAYAWRDLAGNAWPLLQVCQAAWRRRYGQQPPVLFEPSSLVQFWHQAAHARELVSLG